MDTNPLRIVFLDIDGVLNSERYAQTCRQPSDELWTLDDIDPEAVEILNRILDLTDARFVLSSSWRHHHTLDEVAALLHARGFAGKLIDATPRLFGDTRGAEIRTWLHVQAMPPQAFAVLDDEPATAELEQFWIRTDPAVGVTVSDVQRIVALLASPPRWLAPSTPSNH